MLWPNKLGKNNYFFLYRNYRHTFEVQEHCMWLCANR